MKSYYDKEKIEDFRIIYNNFYEDFRITIQDIAASLGLDPNTTSNRINKALDGEHVITPQIRKRSFKNFKEYIYIITCDNPLGLFKKLKEDSENIVYHAALSGFADMWAISKEKIDIDGDVLVEGLRSDYHIAHAPNQLFREAKTKMLDMVERFDKKGYEPQNFLKTHWHETIDWWDSDYEVLYRYFKFDGRKPYTPIMKENRIPSRKINHFLRLINETCTVFTQFFPNGMSTYDPYLFMIETDYEDFIINLFSQLPTSPFFFKAENRLFVVVQLERVSIRETGIKIHDISHIWIPCLFEKLLEKSIIKNEKHANFEYHWSKEL
jgi:hypothetical protein